MTIPRITVLPLLLACVVLLDGGQSEDIYQRVKRTLGDAAAAQLKSRSFSQLEERLAAMTPANDAEDAELLALKGAIEFLDGKMAEAAADFRESEKIQPAKEGDRFTLAMALVRLGEEDGARNVLASLAREHANTAIYWYWLGRLDYYQRRYGEAVENLERAVKLDPSAARGWDSLGLAWDMQGHMQQAREDFEKAVELNRDQKQPSPWPPHNLGYLLLRMGETAKAEEVLRESLRYDEKLARTHYYLARTLEKEERADEAIAEYQIAVAEDKAATDSCYSLAMLFRKLHREDDAKAMFAEFKRRKGSEPEANR
jgi:tetratricopeptide (TPR) repeat protein